MKKTNYIKPKIRTKKIRINLFYSPEMVPDDLLAACCPAGCGSTGCAGETCGLSGGIYGCY